MTTGSIRRTRAAGEAAATDPTHGPAAVPAVAACAFPAVAGRRAPDAYVTVTGNHGRGQAGSDGRFHGRCRRV